ncbi:helix-turn-helix transcriptional regulator [Streptomyces sp. NBC_01244]|uniref:helix-turn-helix transcriptional regulator n=1 Tax=Streptomyces sp. NBC_01244 TaxID=2903797 RepID=UPI002E0E111E|nr:LuxR C-terminal-related transcriptional regulator [Streptomyces sp. NBC_01244]
MAVGPVLVRVVGGDPITDFAMAACLEQDARVEVLDPKGYARTQVVLALAFGVGGDTLTGIRRAVAEARSPGVPVVLVAESITEADRARVEALGLVGLVHRPQADADIVVRALLYGRDAQQGPPDGTRGPRGAGADTADAPPAEGPSGRGTDSHPRELDVLRLLSEGLSTAEISARLNYSQRTIKAIIQRILVRQGLRNRPNAVAYALRRNLL